MTAQSELESERPFLGPILGLFEPMGNEDHCSRFGISKPGPQLTAATRLGRNDSVLQKFIQGDSRNAPRRPDLFAFEGSVAQRCEHVGLGNSEALSHVGG